MIPCTITYGHLRVDRDGAGNLTLARSDRKEVIRLSRTEWVFVLKAAEVFGMPVCPSPGTIDTKST